MSLPPRRLQTELRKAFTDIEHSTLARMELYLPRGLWMPIARAPLCKAVVSSHCRLRHETAWLDITTKAVYGHLSMRHRSPRCLTQVSCEG